MGRGKQMGGGVVVRRIHVIVLASLLLTACSAGEPAVQASPGSPSTSGGHSATSIPTVEPVESPNEESVPVSAPLTSWVGKDMGLPEGLLAVYEASATFASGCPLYWPTEPGAPYDVAHLRFDAADQYPDGSIGYDFNLGGGDYVSIGVHIPETGYDAAIIADTPSEVQSNGSTIHRYIDKWGAYVSAAVLFPGVQCDVNVSYWGQATDQSQSDLDAIASSLVVVATPN